jgi:hypothetical protein
MTEPDGTATPLSLAATARESPEESVRSERELVGEAPDTGPLVPGDDAQSDPDD